MCEGEAMVDDDAFCSTVKKGFCNDFVVGDTSDEVGVEDEGTSLSVSRD